VSSEAPSDIHRWAPAPVRDISKPCRARFLAAAPRDITREEGTLVLRCLSNVPGIAARVSPPPQLAPSLICGPPTTDTLYMISGGRCDL